MNQTLVTKDLVVARELSFGEVEFIAPLQRPKTGLLPATGIHPGAIGIALGASATLLVAAWAGFAGGETSLVLAMVTVICLVFFGCLVGGGMTGRNMTPERRKERSFAEFLNGKVDIATGRITGKEALVQVVAMPITLAVGGIAIIAIAFWTA